MRGKIFSILTCSYHQRSPLAPEPPDIFVWDVLSRYSIGYTFLLFSGALPPVVEKILQALNFLPQLPRGYPIYNFGICCLPGLIGPG